MLERSKMFFSDEQLNKFCNSNVLIVGVGGVGGACALDYLHSHVYLE